MKRFRNTDYFVTENGEIFSEKSGELVKMKPAIMGNYHRVDLCINGISQAFAIHRIIVECYISKPVNKYFINHINGNTFDNRVENLECVEINSLNIKRYKDTNYYVNKNGDVFSLQKDRLSKIKPAIVRGYYNIVIRINRKRVNIKHHRLVAELFIPNPENKPQVNHINGNTFDNRVENLEWVTSKENNIHRTKVLKKGVGETNGMSKLTEEDVKYIRDMYIPRHKEFGRSSLAKKFNIRTSTIDNIIYNRSWQHL